MAALDEEGESITLVDLATGQTDSVDVGSPPRWLTSAAEQVWATLPASFEVVRLVVRRDDGDTYSSEIGPALGICTAASDPVVESRSEVDVVVRLDTAWSGHAVEVRAIVRVRFDAGPIVQLSVDLDSDGRDEIVGGTVGGRLVVLGIERGQLAIESSVQLAAGAGRPTIVDLDLDEVPLPQSVRLAIQSRVGKLPGEAQGVLRLAAIVGREFDFDTLSEACELNEDALVDALEAAEQAQLIGEVKRNGRETFTFAHGLTMATLREGVSGLRRRRLHRRVATAIEALRPEVIHMW